MINKRKLNAFTLVELLIVIALIGILSVAVLATINPIEQANKARDAKYKNDAAEVLGALERYYTGQNAYPWNVGMGTTVEWGTDVVYSGTEPEFGVAGVGDSVNVLIATSELKSSFANKEPFVDSVAIQDRMYVYHNGTTGDNYVCFLPKANANRTGTVAPNLKCLDVAGANLYDLGENGGTCVALDDWDSTTMVPLGTNANMLCVPEGDITD